MKLIIYNTGTEKETGFHEHYSKCPVMHVLRKDIMSIPAEARFDGYVAVGFTKDDNPFKITANNETKEKKFVNSLCRVKV